MTTEERDAKCIPITRKVLKMIADFEGPIGDVKKEEAIEAYKELETEVIKLYLEEKLTAGEITYVQQLALQAVDVPLNFVKVSVSSSYERATEKVWGKPEDEINLEDVDKLLS